MQQERRAPVLFARRLQGHSRDRVKPAAPTGWKALFFLAAILVARCIQPDFIQRKAIRIGRDGRR